MAAGRREPIKAAPCRSWDGPYTNRIVDEDSTVGISGVFPKTLFTIAGIPIRDTVLHTWIVVAVLSGLAAWASRRYRTWKPRAWQLALEYIIGYVDGLVISQSGRPIPEIVPFLTTMISFIAISNLLGLLPLFRAPTRDLNTTIALSLVSFGACQYFGIHKRGVKGWLHSFIEPNAVMLPMNLLGIMSRILSMAVRLFGNIVAGEIIGAVFFMLVPLLSPLPMNALGMLVSVLQALVFTVLTLVFIVDAMGPADGASKRDVTTR